MSKITERYSKEGPFQAKQNSKKIAQSLKHREWVAVPAGN